MTTKTAARPKRPAMQIYVPPKLRTALERKSSCERLSEPVTANGDLYAETKDVQETKSPQADQHKLPAMQPQLRTAQERQNSCERLSEAAPVNRDLHAETGDVQETKSPQADQHKRPAMQVFLPPQLRIAQEHQSSCENLSEPALVNGDLLAETKDLQEPKLPQTDEHKRLAIHVPLQSQLPTEKERQNSSERLSEPAPVNGDLHAESKDVQETKSPQAEQHKRPAVRTYVPPQLRTAQARPSSSDDSSTSAQPAQTEPSFKSLKIKQKSKEAVAVAEADKLAQKLGTVSVSKATSSESAPAPLISGFEDNGLLVMESWEKPAVVKVPLGVASSKVLLPEPTLNYGELQHIIELYGFPPTLESSHLQTELRGFEDSGFVLKWVDDSHCLAVFSSPTEATTALTQISGILIKVGTPLR
ncbi:unnamed protein product [Dibothriocephalus latus]|uniref:Uncharacterized protein n=1 Tax=Dibothriocephalus latus TaxID=60516 RepID=A0A3P7MZK1_DIBLA|nr:unnamed protein product [Dibothriocephalus latus]